MSEDLNKVETALSNYSLTDEVIGELGELINPVTISSNEDRKAAAVHARVMRDHRNGLENFRLEQKRKLKAAGEALDTEAKKIQAKLDPVEKGIKDKMKAWDDVKAAEKAERDSLEAMRVQNIHDLLDTLTISSDFIDNDLGVMNNVRSEIMERVISQELYAEFTSEAMAQKNATIDNIDRHIAKKEDLLEASRLLAEQQESAEAQRKENERVAAELAEQKREMEEEAEAKQKVIDDENQRKQDAMDAQQKEIDDAAAEVEAEKQKVIDDAKAEIVKRKQEEDRKEFEKNAAAQAEADAIRKIEEAEALKAKEEELRVQALSDEQFLEEYISKVADVGYAEFTNNERLTNEIRELHMNHLQKLDGILENIRSLIVVE